MKHICINRMIMVHICIYSYSKQDLELHSGFLPYLFFAKFRLKLLEKRENH